MGGYRGLSQLLALTTIALGVAIVIVTAAHGGGQVGFLLGGLFVAAGAGRLFLLRRP
jgi:hypothetical protein